MTLALFRPTFCFFVVASARHGIPLGAAVSTEEDAWMSLTQFQATLRQYDDKAAVPQSFAADFAQGDRACQDPTDALPTRKSTQSVPPAKAHAPLAAAQAVVPAVSTTSACLGVFLKLLTCAVVIDGLFRWFRPQENDASKPCEKCISKSSNLCDFVNAVAQRMGSPTMAILFATLAVSPLVFDNSDLLVALVGGGLYLVVWAVANAPKMSVPAKKLWVDDDDVDDDDDDDVKSDAADAQQEKAVVEDRLLAALKLEHEADVYVPLWQSAPQAWSLLLPESDEEED